MASSLRVLGGSYRSKLGESPVWTDDGRLAFVDIVAKRLLFLDPSAADAPPVSVPLPTAPGCVVRSAKGGLLVALAVDDTAPKMRGGRLVRVHPPPPRGSGGAAASEDDDSSSSLVSVARESSACDVLNANIHPMLSEETSPAMVLNDGAVDARGRVWVGCKLLAPAPADADATSPGALFCCEAAVAFRDGAAVAVGSAQVVPEVGGVHTSNGIGWSPDGKTMYHVDSPKRRVDAYDFDARSGMLRDKRVFASVGSRPNEAKGDSVDSVPDGLCVDVEGGVWVCVWGAGEIVRFVPDAKDGGAGVRDRVVRTPCSRPTSCCFGGGDAATRRTLFVTSCSLDDTVDAGATSVSVEEPDAGAVFAVDVGVEGVEVHAAAF